MCFEPDQPPIRYRHTSDPILSRFSLVSLIWLYVGAQTGMKKRVFEFECKDTTFFSNLQIF